MENQFHATTIVAVRKMARWLLLVMARLPLARALL